LDTLVFEYKFSRKQLVSVLDALISLFENYEMSYLLGDAGSAPYWGNCTAMKAIRSMYKPMRA
ncbi:hypothetical protein, partial [Listeria sp. SHR_NRA_18]|uniref:hypothetical protein n=1 Tax=Listeria sp. SHR_NRA_18 TaxID=2269046 RepID=UPI001F261E61